MYNELQYEAKLCPAREEVLRMYNVTVSEASRTLGLSEPRIYQLIRSGALEAEKVANVWLISQESIRSWQNATHKVGRPRKNAQSKRSVQGYTLMNRNHKVLHFSYSTDTHAFLEADEIMDAQRAPLGLTSPRGARASVSALASWWSHRAIPKYRQDITQKLEELGVENPAEIPFRSLGFSLSDQYWILPDGLSLSWEDANFFQNDFGEAEFDAVWLSEVGLDSPDNTSEGRLSKKWITHEGGRYLLKGGGVLNQEPYNELVATQLYECLLSAGEYVPYELWHLGRLAVSSCACFVSDDEEYIPAYYVRQLLRQPNHHNDFQHYINCCASLGVEDVELALSKMIVCDDILANTDRHWRNFGLIRNVETLEYRVAPLFDMGTSLWCEAPLSALQSRDFSFTTKPFYEDANRQLRLVNDYSWFKADALDDFVEQAHDILEGNDALQGRTEYICEGIERRIDRILLSL